MEATTPFRRSVAIHVRVIHALMLREVLTRYGRNNLGLLWLFMAPALLTVAVTTAWTLFSRGNATKIPIAAFVLTGYSYVILWRGMPGKTGGAVASNRSLLHHRNVRVMDLFISRMLVDICGVTLSFSFLGLAFSFFGLMPPPVDILTVLFGWVMMVWVTMGLALVVGSLIELYDPMDMLWTAFTHILLPLSSSFFMLDWLPQRYLDLMLWSPLANALELCREGFFKGTVQSHYDIPYLTCWCVSLTFLGLALARKAANQVELE